MGKKEIADCGLRIADFTHPRSKIQNPQRSAIAITVLLFAQLKDRFGASAISVSLPPEATGHDLLKALSRMDPHLEPLLQVSRLAVGQEYVSWDHPLQGAEEVAVIPPVSGG